MSPTVVWARQPIPLWPSIFLAGPTQAQYTAEPSWRQEAVRLIGEHSNLPVTVLTPESYQAIRADSYEEQFAWENKARATATVVLYWIPRDVDKLPGFTTNVEFGYDVASGRKVVLGAPPDCPNPERNRYLISLAHTHSVPVQETLEETVSTALYWVQHGYPL